MSNKFISGKPPVGTNGGNVPFLHKEDRAPTVYDWQNKFLMDEWLDTSTNDLYFLVSLNGNANSRGPQATWVKFGGSTDLRSLTGNSGGAVLGDALRNINLLGSGVISVVGNPGTNTLTITPSATILTSFITNPATGTAVPAAGVITLVGGGGTTVTTGGSTITIVGGGGGGGTLNALQADDANIVTDTAGVIIISGGNNLATTGTAGPNTLTVNLDGITQYSVQVGGAANALTQIANGTTGQEFTAVTGSNPIWQTKSFVTNPVTATANAASGVLTFAGAGATVVSASGSTITITSTDTGSTSFPTDSGTAAPAVGILNIKAQNSTLGAGSSVLFSAPGASNTVQLNVTDSLGNTIIGKASGNLTLSGTNSTVVGGTSFPAATSSPSNVIVGQGSATLLAGGSGLNTLIGRAVATGLITGASNTIIGSSAGSGLTNGAESSNILLKNAGVASESNTMRLGTTGAGAGQVSSTYLAGVDGVNVGSVAKVLTMASEKVGTATITAGAGITVTPTANTITIASSGGSGIGTMFVYKGSTLTSTAPTFLAISGSANSNLSYIFVAAPAAINGTLSRFYGYVHSNLSSASVTFAVYVNAAPTGLTFTVGAGATGIFSDLIHTFGVSAGDTMSFRSTAHTSGALGGSLSVMFS